MEKFEKGELDLGRGSYNLKNWKWMQKVRGNGYLRKSCERARDGTIGYWKNSKNRRDEGDLGLGEIQQGR